MNSSGRPEMVAPLVISSPMPRSAVRVASVMMKGGRPSLMMPKPWNVPIAAPMSRVSAIEVAMPKLWVSSQATMTLQKPTTAPTERSMPAVMITKVWPTAMMAVMAPWRIRLSTLFEVRNLSVDSESAIHISASSPTRVRLSRRPMPRHRRSRSAAASSRRFYIRAHRHCLMAASSGPDGLGQDLSRARRRARHGSPRAVRGGTHAACRKDRRLPAGRTRSG